MELPTHIHQYAELHATASHQYTSARLLGTIKFVQEWVKSCVRVFHQIIEVTYFVQYVTLNMSHGLVNLRPPSSLWLLAPKAPNGRASASANFVLLYADIWCQNNCIVYDPNTHCQTLLNVYHGSNQSHSECYSHSIESYHFCTIGTKLHRNARPVVTILCTLQWWCATFHEMNEI